MYFLHYKECIQISVVIGNHHAEIRKHMKSAKEKKKESVKSIENNIDNYRQEPENLLAALSPRKSGKGIDGTRGTRRAQQREILYKAKMPLGEDIDYKRIEVIRPLRKSLLITDYLVRDKDERPFRKRVLAIKTIANAYGIDIWKLRSLLKIYRWMSPFLPEVFRITSCVALAEVEFYTVYFE